MKRRWGILLLILCGIAVGGRIQAEEDGEKTENDKSQKYCLEYAEPDGENGYYHKFPCVKLMHRGEETETYYIFTPPCGETEEGKLTMEEPEKVWEEREMDGEYTLEIWVKQAADAEDSDTACPEDEEAQQEAGEEEEREIFRWKVDGTPPVFIQVSPEYTQEWMRYAAVQAKAEDEGSGVAFVEGDCGGNKWKGSEEVFFRIESQSRNNKPVQVILTASDKAGNLAVKNMEFWIDRNAPKLEVTGVNGNEIVSEDTEISVSISEENRISRSILRIFRSGADGEQDTQEPALWEWTNEGMRQKCLLSQEGIYNIEVETADAAGNTSRWEGQVILDKTPPVIGGVDVFASKWLQSFSWDYREAVSDLLTTCSVRVRLDGMLYPSGKLIETEGRHVLKIDAQDRAGNKAHRTVAFGIDRTGPFIFCRTPGEKKEIEDGRSFTEKAVIEIGVEEEGDWLSGLWINGETQKDVDGKQQYILEKEEKGIYELEIAAMDEAGNKTIRAVGFRIEDEDGTVFRSAVKQKKEEVVQTAEFTGVFIMGLLFLCAAGGIGFWMWREEKKKNLP